MPHITTAEKKELEQGRQVVKMGDACFLFANFAITQFNNTPSWTTIHQIKRALMYPFHNDDTHALIQKHMGHMDKVDVAVAADLAFVEFYRLVGSKYEDKKIKENGDALALEKPIVAFESLPSTNPNEVNLQATVVKRGRGRPKKAVLNA